VHSRVSGGNLRETDHFEYLCINGGVIFNSVLNKYDETLCTLVIWTITAIIGGLLLTL
jgi:hypothetical protein